MVADFADFAFSNKPKNTEAFNRATKRALDLIEERKGQLVLLEAKSGHRGLIHTLTEQAKARPSGVVKFIVDNTERSTES
jgi:hypothetical protein